MSTSGRVRVSPEWAVGASGLPPGTITRPESTTEIAKIRFRPSPLRTSKNSHPIPHSASPERRAPSGNSTGEISTSSSSTTRASEALKDPEHATILGKTQFKWLLKSLRNSGAVFKIIVSGSPFNNNSRKYDSWVSYPKERRRLMKEIISSKIDGVLLLTGDVHRSEIFKLPWLEKEGGYPLYEIVASPLYQRARSCGSTVENRVFCTGSAEHEVCRLYAWFDADTRQDDPSITFQIRGLEEEVLYSQTLTASQLSWGPAKESK